MTSCEEIAGFTGHGEVTKLPQMDADGQVSLALLSNFSLDKDDFHASDSDVFSISECDLEDFLAPDQIPCPVSCDEPMGPFELPRIDAVTSFVEVQARELRAHRRCVEELLERQMELLRGAENVVFDATRNVRSAVSTCGQSNLEESRQSSSTGERSRSPCREERPTFRSSVTTTIFGGRNTKMTRDDMRSEFARVITEDRMMHPFFQRVSECALQITKACSSHLMSKSTCAQHDRVAELVGSGPFTLAMTVVIIVNSVFTGFVMDVQLRETLRAYDDGDVSDIHMEDWHASVEACFVVIFTVELLLRIFAGCCSFFTGRDFAWNLVDAFLVVCSFVELVLPSSGVNLTFFRIDRLLKMVRAFRILRLVRHIMVFRKLRILLMAVTNCLMFMMWAIVVLLVVIFLFSILFLMGVISFVNDAPLGDPTVESVRVFFHSLSMSMLTLWMSCSGGVDWWEIEQLLLTMSWHWGVLFSLFQAMMLLGMLNIVTGFVVQDAVVAMNADKELQQQVDDEKKGKLVQELKAVFHRMDVKGSGNVQKEDFVTFMKDDKVQSLMSKLDVRVADAVMLFDILDVDGDMEVEIDEFVMGAVQLKVQADMLNMTLLLQNNNRLIQKAFKLIHGLSLSSTATRPLANSRWDPADEDPGSPRHTHWATVTS